MPSDRALLPLPALPTGTIAVLIRRKENVCHLL